MGTSKGRLKERRERVVLDVSQPIPLEALGTLGSDNSLEEREDGVKGVGQVSAPRPGRKAKRKFSISSLQQIEAAAVWEPDWRRATEIDAAMRHDGPGRRMETNAMSMIVFGEAVLEFGSNA
ncbi:MAG: hypothetical protein RI958_1029, partial [Actinomycetota bacterium]